MRKYRVQIAHKRNSDHHLLLVSFCNGQQQQQQPFQFNLANQQAPAAIELEINQCHQQKQPITGPGLDIITQLIEGDLDDCQLEQLVQQQQLEQVPSCSASQVFNLPAQLLPQAQPAAVPASCFAQQQQQQQSSAACFQSRRPCDDQDSFDEAVIREFAPPPVCPPPLPQPAPAPCFAQQPQQQQATAAIELQNNQYQLNNNSSNVVITHSHLSHSASRTSNYNHHQQQTSGLHGSVKSALDQLGSPQQQQKQVSTSKSYSGYYAANNSASNNRFLLKFC